MTWSIDISANNNDPGVITANVPAGAHMDAAMAGEIAGVELEVSRGAIRSLTERRDYHSALTLTLDMTPGTMRDLAYMLADKCGWPAFVDADWRTIAEALRACGRTLELRLAERIESGYELAPVEPERAAARLDAHVLDAIVTLMSGVEWDADTPAEVATLVRMTGREILDSDA